MLGLEGDFQGGSINDKTAGAKDNLNWFGTLRGRAGFAMDRALIYATGGAVYGGGTYKELITPAHDSYARLGWTVGGGVEYAVTDSLSIKAEYLYANFGRFKVGGTHATPDFHSVRLGVNFRF